MSSAAIVSFLMRLSANAKSSAIDGSSGTPSACRMLVDGVAGERPGRIGRRRQHVLQAGDLDIGRVAAARAFGVEGMDAAALERLDGVLDEADWQSVSVWIITCTS
jgi:hypothetical protein